MNLIIDGISLAEAGIQTKDFRVQSPRFRRNVESMEGRSGAVELSVEYDVREAEGNFYFATDEYNDYTALRNRVFRTFTGQSWVWVVDEREPGKRWKLRASGFNPEQVTSRYGFFDVKFECYEPFAESIGTTLHPEGGMMSQVTTNYGDPPIQYEFTTGTFSVWNDSDTDIDPREHDLTIEFKGASSGLTIKNLTTGDTWSYTGDTAAEDVIRLEGIRSLKNGSSIFGQSNRQLITLAQGWNEFEITGATDFTISYIFRFLYV